MPPRTRRVGELLDELTRMLELTSQVCKVANAGGGDFDLYLNSGDMYHLHESRSPQFSFDVYVVLQVLSHEVQLEFISLRRDETRQAAK